MNLFRKSRGVSCQDKQTAANHRQVWRTEKWGLLLERKGRNWGGLWWFFIGCRLGQLAVAGVCKLGWVICMRAPRSGLPNFIANEVSFIFIPLRKIKDLTTPAIPPNVVCYLHYYYCCRYYYSLYIV